MKTIAGAVLLAVLCVTGGVTQAAPAKDAPAKDSSTVSAVRSIHDELEYAPLVPPVEWEDLNVLQKTTAAIAIVPGCILSVFYNAYVWMVK